MDDDTKGMGIDPNVLNGWMKKKVDWMDNLVHF